MMMMMTAMMAPLLVMLATLIVVPMIVRLTMRMLRITRPLLRGPWCCLFVTDPPTSSLLSLVCPDLGYFGIKKEARAGPVQPTCFRGHNDEAAAGTDSQVGLVAAVKECLQRHHQIM